MQPSLSTRGVSLTMQTLCFALDLHDDPTLIGEYVDWHRPGAPPREVTESLRAAGISELNIYLCGNRLFMLMQVDDSFSIDAKERSDAANPHVRRWEELMWCYQKALPWS